MILPVTLISAIFYISAALGSQESFHLSEDISNSNNQTKTVEVKTGEVPTTPLANIINETKSKPETIAFPDPCPRSQEEGRDLREIQIPGSDPFNVVCDSTEEFGSGWLVVYSKLPFSKIFNRTYEDYERGFGKVGTGFYNEFFIGLNRLHFLTKENPHEVMVDTNPFNRKRCHNFFVGSRSEGYMLKNIGNCTGSDVWLSPKQGSKFSTLDRDEDGIPDRNLAMEAGFGWWFDSGMGLEYNYIDIYIRRTD